MNHMMKIMEIFNVKIGEPFYLSRNGVPINKCKYWFDMGGLRNSTHKKDRMLREMLTGELGILKIKDKE